MLDYFYLIYKVEYEKIVYFASDIKEIVLTRKQVSTNDKLRENYYSSNQNKFNPF